MDIQRRLALKLNMYIIGHADSERSAPSIAAPSSKSNIFRSTVPTRMLSTATAKSQSK